MVKRILAFVAFCAVAAAIGCAAYFFYLKDNVSWFQTYHGKISGVFEVPDPDKLQYAPHAKDTQFNSHFWEITLDSGRSMRVEVPLGLWSHGGVDTEVVKFFGWRYPAVVMGSAPGEAAPAGENTGALAPEGR